MTRVALLEGLRTMFAQVLADVSLDIGKTENVEVHCAALLSINDKVATRVTALLETYGHVTRATAILEQAKRETEAKIARLRTERPKPPPVINTRVPPQCDFDEELDRVLAISLQESQQVFYESKYNKEPTTPSDFIDAPSHPVRYEQHRSLQVNLYRSAPQPFRLEPTLSTEPDCLDMVDEECSICKCEVPKNDREHMVTPCSHHFHKGCMKQWIDSKQNDNAKMDNHERWRQPVGCPVCREPVATALPSQRR